MGRKPKLSRQVQRAIRRRRDEETSTAAAKEYGVGLRTIQRMMHEAKALKGVWYWLSSHQAV
ncbi:helix-turn-helix domain-containing protein [Asaia sp. As-1742]|uniref:helix-turn-helix domain-containing protein n=1 Tax=Asaia sp. As-1742 TaxID=2608325 RepID=UPI00351A2881